jgi:nucleotide-binding universal stress UspA family protein
MSDRSREKNSDFRTNLLFGFVERSGNFRIQDQIMTSAQTPEVGLKSILLAYDFSETSRKPLHHAIAIARHFQAKLYIAYVVSSIGYEIAGMEASQLAYEGSVRDAHRLEAELLKSGALAGLQYELMIRGGNVWEQLELGIWQKRIGAVIVGTHARAGIGRLVLGSVAEQIFRQADCLVLTVGPGSREDSLIEKKETVPLFLFATDFGHASLCAVPYAASFANHFGAKLVVLHVLPAAPVPETFHWSTTGDLTEMRREAQLAAQKQFQQLIIPNVPAATKLEFKVTFGIPAEQVLQACHSLKVDLLILGLHSVRHAEALSHIPWLSAHEIVCGASCPVLTMKDGTGLSRNSS